MLFLGGFVGNTLITGINIGQSSHVTGALNVILTADRANANAGPSQMAGKHQPGWQYS